MREGSIISLLTIEKLHNGTVVRNSRAAVFIPKRDYHALREILLDYNRHGYIKGTPLNDEIFCISSLTGITFHGDEIINVPADYLKELLK